MARQIKFRAWFDNGKVQDMFFVGDAYGTTHPLDCCRYVQDGQPVTLMQFTGLKDANGVEIYEGDFVSVFDRDDNQFMMSGVVKFGFRGYPGFDIYDERGNTYTDEYNTFTNDDDLYFKVTGSIYQNPERFNDTTKSK